MDRKLLAEFDGNYGRQGIIEVGDATCDVCKQVRVCIIVDASEGEYNAGNVCPECVTKATVGFAFR